MRKGKMLVVLALTAVLAGLGGYAVASIPFGAHVSIGCDVTHGVQTYVSDVNHSLTVVQNGCTEPDIQSRVRVRPNAARGVILYQLHRDPNGLGPIRDIDAIGWSL
jgi:hypothetical protein